MKETEILLTLAVSIIFTAFEIAVTLYANEKTTQSLMKHNDESERQINETLKAIQTMLEDQQKQEDKNK